MVDCGSEAGCWLQRGKRLWRGEKSRPAHCYKTSFGVSSFPKIVNRVSCTIYEFTYLERKTLKVELEYGKTNQKKDAFFCEIVYSITVYAL